MPRHGVYPREIIPPVSDYYESGRFGRMFGKLPAFSSDTPRIRTSLQEIGEPGGIMDAGEDLTADPTDLIVDLNLSANNSNNPNLSAGMTFLGQFIDHDITFDPTSTLERQADPEQIANFRTPSLALDSLYGSGPDGSPHLYDRDDGVKFLLENTGSNRKKDMPRNSENVALIGDPRNDENLIVSQLHTAFLAFHNAAVDYVRDELGLTSAGEVFAEAQRIVRWHYQWMIIHEFLRLTCGQAVVDDILTNGRKFYKWRNEPFIPVEFSVAAYRFGHSQIRPSYRANFRGNTGNQPFIAMIFKELPGNPADPDDLRGSCRARRRFVDWATFFDFGDGEVKPNKKIDTILSTALFRLPGIPNPNPATNPASLAQRNLLRHITFSLPSGQRVARAMEFEPLSKDDLSMLAPWGLDDNTPLWFYILHEASVQQGGERLGEVGGRIVAEVLIGLIEGDRSSYLAQDPEWQPFLPTLNNTRDFEDFTMVDIINFAGLAPD